jgi:Fungal specific transcription factor domain
LLSNLLTRWLTFHADLRVWAPQQGKPFAFEGHPNPYLSLLFPYALQHAVLFESIVALCRVASLLNQGMSTDYDRAFAYHHNNTRYALQMRLNSTATCADDITILTIAALATIDVSLFK